MKFLAILRDSFREAVDGYVIYVMLAFSAVFLALLAGLTFTPAPADQVVPAAVSSGHFASYIPDGGRSPALGSALGVEYNAADVHQDGSDVSFRLTATGSKRGESDRFRAAVVRWMRPPEKTTRLGQGVDPSHIPTFAGTPAMGIELADPTPVPDAEAAAVGGPAMEAFVANLFAVHWGVDDAEVKRSAGPTAEREYAFDVRLPAAATSPGWPQQLGLFFGAVDVGEFPLGITLFIVEDQIVNGLGAAVTLVIAVVITAFFIPTLLRKGSLDLMIAKPIGRSELLVYKYLGGLTFVLLLAVVNFGGTWLVLGLRSGHWDPRFLLAVPMLVLSFALLYAVSTLVAVVTRNAVAAIMLTLGFAFALYVVGQVKSYSDRVRNSRPAEDQWPAAAYTIVDGLNAGLPRYKDLDKLTSHVTAVGSMAPIQRRIISPFEDAPEWAEVTAVTLAYIVLILAVSCWRLSKQDG